MLQLFRQLLIHQLLPVDATEDDILAMAAMIYNGQVLYSLARMNTQACTKIPKESKYFTTMIVK
jgi:hypothetical protein